MTLDVAADVLDRLRDHAAGDDGLLLVRPGHARALVGLVTGLVRGDEDARTVAAAALGIDGEG